MEATTILIISVLLLLTFIFYKKLVQPMYIFEKCGIPGPKPIPVLGNIFNKTLNKGTQVGLAELRKKYGDVYGIFFGPIPVCVVSDPEIIKQVLVKEFPTFTNKVEVKTGTILDLNLESLRDDQWKRVRNILVPSFSASKMRAMIPLCKDVGDVLKEKLTEAAGNNQTIDIHSYFGYYTLELVMLLAFGMRIDSQKDGKDPLLKYAAKVFRPSMVTTIAMSISKYLLPIANVLDSEYFNSINQLAAAAKRVIKERVNSPVSNRKDMLQLMLDAGRKDSSLKLSDDEMVAQALTFLVAGYETTSNTLAFISYILATHQDLQERLINDIDEQFDGDDELNYDRIQGIPLLSNLIDEALRMYPPAYFGLRECSANCTINGYHFAKGVSVIYPIYDLQHDPKYWDNPDQIDPDRFSEERKDSIHPYTYLPFSTGPRACIGMRLALMEVKVTLCIILRNFRFVKAPETEEPLPLRFGTTLSPEKGVKVRIVDRHT